MRFGPILGENEDPTDLRTQWVAFMRTYWYDTMAGPSRALGIAGGLSEPNYEFEWRSILPALPAAMWKPPWTRGALPPHYRPASVVVRAPLPDSVITPKAAHALPWLIPPSVDRAPIFDLQPPRQVKQIDPVADPPSSPIGDLLTDYERHAAQSLLVTMDAAGADAAAAAGNIHLTMTAEGVAGALKRGAEMVYENGKAIVKMGSRVLGPVGFAGNMWDLYQVLRWLSNQEIPQSKLPKGAYSPYSNAIEYTWPDGTVTVLPVSQLPDYATGQ